MYVKIKKVLKPFIPQKLLFKAEPLLRKLIAQFYRGRKFQCNICNSHLRKFIVLDDGDLLCPCCGSLARHRRLKEVVVNNYLIKDSNVLDFSPARSLYRFFKKIRTIKYTSSDFASEFISDVSYDIKEIAVADNHFDLIICYHVLEHIDQDEKAISELYRVLKKGGICLIQTPFKEGNIYEDSLIVGEEEREKHFGQKDHVRVYSVSGLSDRLKCGGFNVDVQTFSTSTGHFNGLKESEVILVCSK